MNKYMVYIPWERLYIVEVEIVKETTHRYYLRLEKPVLGDINWVPTWVDKDSYRFFDAVDDAFKWCASQYELRLSREQEEFKKRMTEIQEAYARLNS